jgi:hypothetical protein
LVWEPEGYIPQDLTGDLLCLQAQVELRYSGLLE